MRLSRPASGPRRGKSPPETGAFVQVFVEERADAERPLAWRKVFSGWLFRNSPSLNVVEHPIYDVWVKDCAMKLPGRGSAAAPATASRCGEARGGPAPRRHAAAFANSRRRAAAQHRRVRLGQRRRRAGRDRLAQRAR